MATSLRRSPGGPDSATVKFLFAVIKQLETKSVNWQMVADEIKITNGHAARMRFSRLKAQVEGNPPYGKGNRNADGTVRKKRKTDIRTERKREAERAAAEAAARANGQAEDTTVKMEVADTDVDAHADDEGDYSVPHEVNFSTLPTFAEPRDHEEIRVKMEAGHENDIVMG